MTGAGSAVTVPRLEEILWDYRTREILNDRLHWILYFGAAENKDSYIQVSANTTDKIAMCVSIEASLKHHHGITPHSGYVALGVSRRSSCPRVRMESEHPLSESGERPEDWPSVPRQDESLREC